MLAQYLHPAIKRGFVDAGHVDDRLMLFGIGQGQTGDLLNEHRHQLSLLDAGVRGHKALVLAHQSGADERLLLMFGFHLHGAGS